MTNNEDIVLDDKSGISLEEQRKILAEINGVAEKNKLNLFQPLSLSEGTGKKQLTLNSKSNMKRSFMQFKAKKSGGLFPLLVNVSALVLLAGGVLLFSSFHGRTEAQVREGKRVYSTAERALIEEIRRETASKIALKESEIAQVVSNLNGIGTELRALYSGRAELTAEQRITEERLLALQSEYSSNYTALHDERSQILDDSRSSEAILRARLESRTNERLNEVELASDREELSSAREELRRLSAETERAAAVEAQMGGGLAAVHDLIRSDKLREAGEALMNLRLFLDIPAFRNNRSIQAKREFYSQAINSLEVLLDDAVRSRAAGIAPPSFLDDAEKEMGDLRLKASQLEETIDGLNKTIEALSSGSSGQARRLTELENTVSNLRNQNTTLQRTVTTRDQSISALQATAAEKDRAIAALESTASERDRTLSSAQSDNTRLNNTIRSLESDKTSLNNTLRARENTISTIQEVIKGKNLMDMSFTQLSEDLTKIQNALGNQ